MGILMPVPKPCNLIAWFWDRQEDPIERKTLPKWIFRLKLSKITTSGCWKVYIIVPKHFTSPYEQFGRVKKMHNLGKLFLPVQTGDKQNITLKLPTQSECKIYSNIFENFQKIQTSIDSKKIILIRKNYFFIFWNGIDPIRSFPGTTWSRDKVGAPYGSHSWPWISSKSRKSRPGSLHHPTS